MSIMGTTAALRARIAGTVLEPSDEGYESARKVYNASIDRHPLAVVRCANADDVSAAIGFARTLGVPVAIRGGGHSGAGFGTCDAGVVVDLSPMRNVQVDPQARTIAVQGGATWADVDRAGHPHGLTVPCGIISTTGVGGLTLGGGHGYLARQCGLTIDNLLEAEVVLADGRRVTASARSHPDLFWAIRGGGGNFGVVTRFLFKGQPVTTVIGGPMLWPLAALPELMRFFDDEVTRMPPNVYAFFATLTVPPGPPFPEALHLTKACGIVWCSTAPADEAKRAMDRFRSFRTPSVDLVGELPMPAINSMFDALFVPGLHWYWKGDFFNGIPDAAIEAHGHYSEQLPSMLSTMHLYPVDGAVQRIAPDATAWGYRTAKYSAVIVAVDPDHQRSPEMTRWAKEYWQALHPHSTGAAYVNFMMGDEGQERVRATYGGNYDRLVAAKRTYDPDNVFCFNQNIAPA